jgi:hypothetical protein
MYKTSTFFNSIFNKANNLSKVTHRIHQTIRQCSQKENHLSNNAYIRSPNFKKVKELEDDMHPIHFL